MFGIARGAFHRRFRTCARTGRIAVRCYLFRGTLGDVTGHVADATPSARLRRSAILAAIVLGSMLAAPGQLRAVDPTPTPSAHPEMFRQPDETGSREPRGA